MEIHSLQLPVLTPADGFGSRLEDLAWIDQWVANVRPYVRVRVEDRVLIKLPMDVYALNAAAVSMLDQALRGEPAARIAQLAGAVGRPDRLFQIHTFFCDVRDLLQNRIGDGRGRPTTRVSPFEGSYTKYPVLSEIAVTYRCNLACGFCYAGCGTADARPGNADREPHVPSRFPWRRGRQLTRTPQRPEMTAAEVKTVIDQLAMAGRVPSVSFTGGECTLRDDLPAFIAHARTRGMRVNIITNAIRCGTRAYVDQLVDAGLTSAQVSLPGSRPDVHDPLAGRSGAFERTVRGIEQLRDAGLHVHTNTTVCQGNVEYLCEIIDLAKSLGLPHVSMNQLIPTGSANLPRHQRLRVSYRDIGPHILRAQAHARRVGLEFLWYSPTPFCLFNPIAHGLGNKGCAACDGLIHVSPTGDVLPCSSFARGVGNLLELGFDKVWFGKQARYYKQKQYAHPICRDCRHFPLCQGACTLYWSGMGYGELLEAQTTRKS
jgi:radical SAM protein with 4Fe4S-binding SPASM domain